MNFIKRILLLAKENGYRSYEVKGYDSFGHIVTPNDNVLGVNKGTFGGVTFTFEYMPSREHGMGCACFEDALYVVDIDDLIKAETEGKAFAFRLGAKRYSSSKEWLQRNYWNQKNMLTEVKTPDMTLDEMIKRHEAIAEENEKKSELVLG